MLISQNAGHDAGVRAGKDMSTLETGDPRLRARFWGVMSVLSVETQVSGSAVFRPQRRLTVTEAILPAQRRPTAKLE